MYKAVLYDVEREEENQVSDIYRESIRMITREVIAHEEFHGLR